MNSNQRQKSALISAEQLSKLMQKDGVKVLETHMKFPVNSAGIVDSDQVIPGALFFDFENTFVDLAASLPHMLPKGEYFSEQMSALNIENNDVLVVYDNQGMFSAPRVWWMLKCMGHEHVYVLNGGLKAWISAGYDVEARAEHGDVIKSQYEARLHPELVIDASTIVNNLHGEDMVICDARGAGRFNGTEPEPREGVRSGHIPTAKNLHYASLLEDGVLQEKRVLQESFERIKASSQSKWIFTCGSGVTACILALAAHELGIDNWAVYDGSWSEWGADHSLPLANTKT